VKIDPYPLKSWNDRIKAKCEQYPKIIPILNFHYHESKRLFLDKKDLGSDLFTYETEVENEDGEWEKVEKKVPRSRAYFETGGDHFYRLQKYIQESCGDKISYPTYQRYMDGLRKIHFYRKWEEIRESGHVIGYRYYIGHWMLNEGHRPRLINRMENEKSKESKNKKGWRVLEDFSVEFHKA